jgi:hypothetical protein
MNRDQSDDIPPDPFLEDGLAPMTAAELEKLRARVVSGPDAVALSARDWVRLQRATFRPDDDLT